MSLFRKIFGPKSDDSREQIKSEERSKYMPEIELPIDERFTINFKANGGKFLYCENQNEVNDNFNKIIIENEWTDKEVMILDERLAEKFDDFNLKSTKKGISASYFFTTCEYLIANDGSLLISSKQIAEKKLKDLPTNFVIFATISGSPSPLHLCRSCLQRFKILNKKIAPGMLEHVSYGFADVCRF